MTATVCTRFHMASNTQLSGEDAEDQNVIHILTAGASSERMQCATSTACYVAVDTLSVESWLKEGSY